MEEPGQDPGASGSDLGQTPPTPGAVATAPKLERKDNAYFLDGRKVVYESDLIAAKKSLEGQLEQAQAVHNSAIDTTKLELSASQQQIAQLNAKLQELEQARQSGAADGKDAAEVKQELEAAKSGLESATSRILELRRANIILTSQGAVTEEQLKDKNLSQLDSFEEALKALSSSRGGIGPYATGGGTGGAAPETPMERAARIIASTPVRGTRTAETK